MQPTEASHPAGEGSGAGQRSEPRTARLARAALREPLVHFALLGVLLFALHAHFAPPAPGRQILVDEAVRQGLRQDHLRRTGALPTAEEESALIERWIDTEVLTREALALGLDRGDAVVRRRLVQKMEFVAESLAPTEEPDDATLERFVADHPERYASPPRVALTHVFVASERHGPEAAAIATQLGERLRTGADPSGLGDPFARGREIGPATERELAGVFGPAFASRAMTLPVGHWSGPLRSSYGQHLVRVRSSTPGEPARLGEAREQVRLDWQEARREERRHRALAELRRGYAIRVDPPAAGGAR